MKVTSDGCLFGAVAAAHTPPTGHGAVLDIGAGTGLLTLMFAQQHPHNPITAIELDPWACKDARQNFNLSPWAARIRLLQQDFFMHRSNQPYAVILCNPPFHQNQLASPQPQRQLAHHHHGLGLSRLLHYAAQLLAPEGWFWLLLPAYRQAELLQTAAQCCLHLHQLMHVYPSPDHKAIRLIVCLKKQPATVPPAENRLHIYQKSKEYSPAFSKLLAPYYLHLPAPNNL